MTIEAFHGSVCGTIEHFNQFSHFGTHNSALAAAAAKYFSGENHERDEAWLYTVDLNFSDCQCMLVSDFGGPRVAHFLLYIEDSHPRFAQAAKSLRQLLVKIRAVDFELEKKLGLYALDVMVETMEVIAFKYANEIEDAGKLSYVILRSDQAKTKNKVFLGRDQLIKGYGLLSPERQRTLTSPESFWK